MLPFNLFTGFYIHHLPVSYLKTSFGAVWDAEPDLLMRSCAHRFRNDADVNQWIVQFWQYATGRFSPRSPKFGAMYEGRELLEAAVRDIGHGRHKAVCWNDAADIDDFDACRARIEQAFSRILPATSAFERGA